MLSGEEELNKAILNDDAARVAELLNKSFCGIRWRSIFRCLRLSKPGQNSLLHLAAYSNSVNAARLLIENGEDINYRNGVGDTPLHIAAYYNAWETADLLISRGAHIDIINAAGFTPLDAALNHSNHKLAELLKITAKRLINREGDTDE
jgi:ankyrin repeat protein